MSQPSPPFVSYYYPIASRGPVIHQANVFVPLYQAQAPGPVHQPVAPLPYFETPTIPVANIFQATMPPQVFHTMTSQDSSWNIDTGASSHLADNTSILTSFSNSSMYPSVFVGNGHSIPVTHTGHSLLHTSSKPLLTPHIMKNLISVHQFTRDNDVSVEFDAYGFSVKDYKTGQLLFRCDSTGDLYPVTQQPSPQTSVVLLSFSSTTLHRRLGHPGDDVLRCLESKNLISCRKSKLSALCHACQLGKHAKLPFYNSESSIDYVFEIIHSHIRTSPIPSESVIKYYAIFLDHFLHFVWVYPLHKKFDLFDNFVAFRAYVNKQFNVDIKALQCDHGGEYDNTRFHDLFRQNGIQFCFLALVPRNRMENPSAEALNMVARLLNILPSTTINNEIPFTKLYNQTPTYEHLRVFGCLCYPHVDVSHKLEPRYTPCIFLGYPANHRGYRCLDLASNKIIISRHVRFDEEVFPFGNVTSSNKPTYDFLLPPIQTTTNVPTTEPFVQHIDEPNNLITPHPTTPLTSPPQPDTPPSHSSTPIPPQPDTHPSLNSTPIPTSAQTQSHSHTPITINNSSQTMSTHPMVTRAKADIFKPLELSRDWPIHQLDVKNAFLHGHLSETVYMHQSLRFVDPTKPDYVCHLQRSLYGLKQASRSDIAYLLLYVDDIILTTSSSPFLQQIIASLHSEFAMTDLGSLNYFLGISAQRPTSGLFLLQSKFTEEILERIHIQHCNPCRTLVDTESKLGYDGDPVSDHTL
ncbi:ribonuclease H-like domain-containing protein [Tanacetum coccineum]